MKLWKQHFYVVKLIKISTRIKETKTKRWGVTECLCLCNVSFDSFYKWQCYSNRNDKNTDNVCVINPTVREGRQRFCSTGLKSLTAGNNSMLTLCLAINITLYITINVAAGSQSLVHIKCSWITNGNMGVELIASGLKNVLYQSSDF